MISLQLEATPVNYLIHSLSCLSPTTTGTLLSSPEVLVESVVRSQSIFCIESKLQQTTKEISNGNLSYLVVDTGDILSLEGFVTTLLKKDPDVDCLVNNAGIQQPMDLTEDIDLSTVDQEIDINIRGVVHLTARLLPHLQRKKGTIINVSSILAFIPLISCPIYNATKAFVHSWTWSLRAQLSPAGVRVIGIYPPTVETDLHRSHDDPNNNKKYKNPSSMSIGEFMRDVSQDLENGQEDIGAGMAKQFVGMYRDAFTEGTRKVNGSS